MTNDDTVPMTLTTDVLETLIRTLIARGLDSGEIANALGLGRAFVRALAYDLGVGIPADSAMGRSRDLDSTAIVAEIVAMSENACRGLALVDLDEVDMNDSVYWIAALGDVTAMLTSLRAHLVERLGS